MRGNGWGDRESMKGGGEEEAGDEDEDEDDESTFAPGTETL